MTTYRVLRASDDVIAAPGQTVTYDDQSNTWVPSAPTGSGTSGTVPIFPTLAEAEAYEAENPGSTAYYISLDDGLTHVVATPPTFTDLSGTENDTYTVPSLTGVVYKVSGSAVPAGTYPGSGTVTVTAEAESGYAIDGAKSWSHTFSSGIAVTPAAPTADDTTNRITIPMMTGVDYKIGGTTVTGNYDVGNVATTVTVTAVAQSGYTLTGTTSWPFVFTTSAADLPAGQVALWQPASLPASGAVASWVAEGATHTFTPTNATAAVGTAPGGVKYMSVTTSGADDRGFSAPVAVTPAMAVGVTFRIAHNDTLVSTASPGIFHFKGVNEAGLNIIQSDGPKYRLRSHGSYVTDDVVDLNWHHAVMVFDDAGADPMLRFYLDGALVHSEASIATVIGLTTVLWLSRGASARIDYAACVVYDRSLDATEVANLTGYLTALTGIVP